MTEKPSASSEASTHQTPLESWKEIAAYLQRDVSTVRRWEKSEELPVHRHRHNARSSIYAYPGELDAWRAARQPQAEQVLPRKPLWRQPLPSLAFSLALVLALVSVGSGLILQPVQVSAQIPGPTMTARRIWVGPRINFYGMGPPSRDGGSLSFVDRRSLAVRDLTSGETRRLKEPSDPAEQAEFSVVSPDGKWIAYEWDIGDFDELRMMAVDGSEDRILYRNPETESIRVQAWSPDQKRLVVVRRLKDQTWQIALVSARSSDAPGLGRDARVEVQFSADGDYFVAVNDQRFSQQKTDFYRLTIAEYDYADGVFPLGWQRGEVVEAEFFGGNLPRPLRSKVSLDDVPSAAGETLVSVPGSHASLPFIVGHEPEVIEPSGTGQKDLPEGAVVNGRLANQGEIDRYALNVQAGEKWAFELQSGELDGSDLYGVLTIADDNNEVIASAGTHQGDPNPYVIATTGQTSSHPFINLEVPPGVRKLAVSVEDLLQRGGPSFSYRLVARKQPPDFLLTLNTPFVNIPLRGSAIVTVKAERRGYDGRIDLSVPNAPDDLIVQGGYIAAYSGLGNTRPASQPERSL